MFGYDEKEPRDGTIYDRQEPILEGMSPRAGGALALVVGAAVLVWERSSALGETHRYHPKFVLFGTMAVALGIPAFMLGIGRRTDWRVPWKAVVLGLFALAGLYVGFLPGAWLFVPWP